MSTSPFGAAGFGFPAFDPAQFERLGRQWLATFTPAAPPAAPDAFAWWKPAPATAAQTLDPTALAQAWMSQMQQLAAQFGGRDAQAADIARAWRVLVGENPFAQAAARRIADNTDLPAREIVEKASNIAADICIYTNRNLVIEELKS